MRLNTMDINKVVGELAAKLLRDGYGSFSDEARDRAIKLRLGINDLAYLEEMFRAPPNTPEWYSSSKYGLNGWLNACQFAIFELIYNVGEMAIPFLKRIAFGDYDWTQGRAVEILCRLAADNFQRDSVVDELKENIPKMRYEALLHAAEGLQFSIIGNMPLARVLAELGNEMHRAFQEVRESR